MTKRFLFLLWLTGMVMLVEVATAETYGLLIKADIIGAWSELKKSPLNPNWIIGHPVGLSWIAGLIVMAVLSRVTYLAFLEWGRRRY